MELLKGAWWGGLAVAGLGLLACEWQPRSVGDLDAMQERGELRAIVRPGFSGPPVYAGGGIDEATLLRQLAARLGMRLHLVRAARHDQVLPWLVEGRGDLGISRLSPAALLEMPDVVGSAAVDWVEDLVVAGARTPVDDLDRLNRVSLHLHRSAASWLLRPGLLESRPRLLPVPEEVPLATVLERVRSGRYAATVIDSLFLEAGSRGAGVRVLGPLAERRPMVWATRAGNPRLRAAVDDFLFAEKVLARGTHTTACRDLAQVRQTGVLRLITRNSPTTCTVERGGLEGFEYDLALSFARDLGGGMRLELAMPPPEVDPLEWLETGYGDIAALHEPIALEDEGRFLVTSWYRRVDLVSVVSARMEPAASVEDLAGERVVAARPVASLCRQLPLDPYLEAAVPWAGADALTALLEVERGREARAVVDEDTARLELADRPGLRREVLVLPDVPLVWVLNPSAPELHRVADAFLRRSRRSGLVRQLVLSELGGWNPYVPRTLPKLPPGALTPFDEVLKWAGRSYGIDWRLLASLMYEESRFDPDAVGPGGSAGLFQLMPFTWRELGVDDPHHPAEATEAGARYLRQMMDKFNSLLLPDRVAMAIASYNVGPRHVFDARRLATEMGLDRDRWAGNVETAMVILDNTEVARRFPAGVCRCRRAVGYTRRILRRYHAYAEQFPPAAASR